MTYDGEDDRIRALLREAHRADGPCPPFQKLVRESQSVRRARHRRVLRAAGLLALAAGTSAVAVLWLRGERPPARAPAGALAWSSGTPRGPLDFLLELPRPPPFEALPSLRVLPQTHRR